MTKFADFFNRDSRLLLAIASQHEMVAVLKALEAPSTESPGDWNAIHFDRFSVLQTGVGKVNAAGAVAKELAESVCDISRRRNYSAVLCLGIAGSLRSEVGIGSTVFASSVVLADEGTPNVGGVEWTSLEESGWAQVGFACAGTDWADYLLGTADHVGRVATVSTISGTDAIASDYVERTGAIAEEMEGAAVAQVCLRFGLPFADFRVVSNRCGNRKANKLDIPTAFKRLAAVVSEWDLRCVSS